MPLSFLGSQQEFVKVPFWRRFQRFEVSSRATVPCAWAADRLSEKDPNSRFELVQQGNNGSRIHQRLEALDF